MAGIVWDDKCYDIVLIAGYLNYHWSVGLLQVGLYILTPYLVSSITALGILSMETRGKNSSLFGMSAILLSISYGVIGSIPRALFVTTLWIWAVAFLVSGLLFVIQIKNCLAKWKRRSIMHELKLMDVQKNTRIKKQSENSIIHLQWCVWTVGRKWCGKNNINEIDLWCFAANEGKYLL